jgi:hypothetical protein
MVRLAAPAVAVLLLFAARLDWVKWQAGDFAALMT